MALELRSGDNSMHERVTGTTALKFMAAIDKAIDEAGSGQYKAFKLLTELDGMGLEIVAKEYPSCHGVGTRQQTDSVPKINPGEAATA